nr:MAG TPA: hypothetical protein [Caudoviricetes sp.]
MSDLRKSMLILSMRTGTSFGYLQEMSLLSLYELMKDYVEVMTDGRRK